MATYTGSPELTYANGQVVDTNKVPLLINLANIAFSVGAGNIITHVVIYTKYGTNISSATYPIQDLIPTIADNYLINVPFDGAFTYVAAQVFYTDGESAMSTILRTFSPPASPVLGDAIRDVNADRVVAIVGNNVANNERAFLELRYNVYYSYTDVDEIEHFGSNQSILPAYDNDALGALSLYRYVNALDSVPTIAAGSSIYVNVQEVIRIVGGVSDGVEITGPLNSTAKTVNLGGTPTPPLNLLAAGTELLDVTVTFDDSEHQSLIPISHYVLERSENGGNSWAAVTIIQQGANNDANSFLDTDIVSGTGYTYRVKAVSISGVHGDFSDSSNVINFTPVAVVTNTAITQVASGSDLALGPVVTISWTDTQPNMLRYEVFTGGVGSGSIGSKLVGGYDTSTDGVRTYSVTHNTDYSVGSYTYTIVATAVNDDFSTVALPYTMDKIAAPVANITQNPDKSPTFVISWTAPSNANVEGGDGTVRLVKYQIVNIATDTIIHEPLNTDTTWTTPESGFSHKNEHAFMVRAVGVNSTEDNMLVRGWIAATATILNAYVSFTISTDTHLSVPTLHWDPLSDSATTVQSVFTFVSNSTPTKTTSGAETSVVLPDSAYNTTFTYRVYSMSMYEALNYAGNYYPIDAPYETVTFTTPIIGVATNVSVEVGAGTVNLSWDRPANRINEAYLSNMGYHYLRTSAGPLVEGTINNLPFNTTTTTTAVLPAGTYDFEIISYSTTGVSNATESFSVTVSAATPALNLTANGATNTVYGTFKNPEFLNGTNPSGGGGFQVTLYKGVDILTFVTTHSIIPFVPGTELYTYDFNNLYTPSTFQVRIQLIDGGTGSGDGQVATINVVASNRPIINAFAITSDGVVTSTVYGNTGLLLDLVVVPFTNADNGEDTFYNIVANAVVTDDPAGNVGKIHTITNLNLGNVVGGAPITSGSCTGALVFASNSSGVTYDEFVVTST